MRSSCREDIVETFDDLEADFKRALDLSFDVLTTPERLRVLERWEQMRRSQPAVEHLLINQLAAQADTTELEQLRASGVTVTFTVPPAATANATVAFSASSSGGGSSGSGTSGSTSSGGGGGALQPGFLALLALLVPLSRTRRAYERLRTTKQH